MEKNPFENIGTKITGSLPGRFKLSWVENSLDADETNFEKINISHTRSYLGKSISLRRIKIFALVLFFGLCAIFGRAIFLQIVRGNYYKTQAEKNRIRYIPIPAQRGIIFDRFGKELVQNVPSFLLSIVPQQLPKDPAERKKIIERVAVLSDVPFEDIETKLKKFQQSSYQSLVIKENLDYESALKLYTQNSDLPGISIENSTKRYYVSSASSTSSSSPSSLSHVLGYLGKIHDQEWDDLQSQGYLVSDNIGRTGVEKTYEKDLRGQYGYKKIEVDALEREQGTLSVEPPIPGKNVYLTIDAEAQAKMETLIKNTLEKLHKKRAAGIAMNPLTGDILALVSFPVFNNNDFSGGISSAAFQKYNNDEDQPLFNRAVSGLYPPGSTAKLMVAAAALQEKIINQNTTFNSTGGLHVNRWFFPDWKAGGHGLTNVTKAIASSVNTFFYYVGGGYDNFVGMGVDKIVEYLRKFHIGQKTGIDLPGEKSGFVPTKEWKQKQKNEPWFIGDTYNLSIGQGDLLVTPLQVALWTSTIVNGGQIVEPHVMGKTVSIPDKKEQTFPLKNTDENFISSENLAIVKQGMRDCVTAGSCQMLKSLPFSSGGKTGTAQWNKNYQNHAWFTAFAPFNNPQIVVTILVEEGDEGSAAAEPIGRDFLDWWGKKYLTPQR
jgi:penicillin-binding protein 2